MSKELVYEIKTSDCVGDSVSKHNYNVLSLDTEICNLSSTFFNIQDNYLSVFGDLCANIDNFNAFSDVFFDPIDVSEAATATQYLSSYWERNEITLTYPINIYEDGIYGQSKIFLNDQVPNDLLAQYAAVHLNRTYNPALLEPRTIANVVFLLYSNSGKLTQKEDVSLFNASANNIQITEFDSNGRYVVPRGITNISIIVVGGGGGGGQGKGGGGGGGGIAYYPNLAVSQNQTFLLTVGNGGNPSGAGGTSRFGNIIAYGGGAGKNGTSPTEAADGIGALGGNGGTAAGGLFNYNGAIGGLGEIPNTPSTQGSDGVLIDILNKRFSGGGGGGGANIVSDNVGGLGGGGKGGGFGNITGANGIPNTGGGGGGGGGTNGKGGRGGKGVVIVVATQPTSTLQSKRYYNITQRKDDMYTSRIKVARFIVSQNKKWTFLQTVQ